MRAVDDCNVDITLLNSNDLSKSISDEAINHHTTDNCEDSISLFSDSFKVLLTRLARY